MKTALAATIDRMHDADGGLRCRRCGGLMVPERLYDLAAPGVEAMESWGWRCVTCGERVDPLILRHRRDRAGTQRQSEDQVETGSLCKQ